MNLPRNALISIVAAGVLGVGAIGTVAAQSSGGDSAPVTQEETDDAQRCHRGAAFKIKDATAAFLGLTPEELGQQLRDGATPAAIAAEQSIDAADLIAHLVGVVSMQVKQAAADGQIDADRAAAILANVEQRISTFVTEGPHRGHHPFRPTAPSGSGDATIDVA